MGALGSPPRRAEGPGPSGAAAPGAGAAPRISLGDQAESLGLLLRLAQLTAFERFFAAEAARPPSPESADPALTLAERSILALVAANDGPRQGEVADALHLRWPLMTKLVRGLEARGLVGREVPPDDRRSVRLRLTPAGAALAAGMAPRMRALDRESLAMIDDAERAELVRLLRRVAGLDGPGGRPGEDR